jgi:4-hydroxy-2-oxoheptanedioate aldolase
MFASHALPGVVPGIQYDEGAEKGLLVIVQIESKSGVENIEKIVLVDGVDVIFIGKLMVFQVSFS